MPKAPPRRRSSPSVSSLPSSRPIQSKSKSKSSSRPLPSPHTHSRTRPSPRPSLQSEIEADEEGTLRPSRTEKAKREEEEEEEDEEESGRFLSASLSGKILKEAERQQRGEERDDEEDEEKEKEKGKGKEKEEEEEEEEEKEEEEEEDGEADEGVLELSAEDEASLSHFLPQRHNERQWSQLIASSLERHQAALAEQQQAEGRAAPLDPKVVAVYAQVGVYLSHFTSGKIPKAFKIVPTLTNWEQVLFTTSPENWTVQAVSAASRLFAANLNEKMAQRFFSLILYPRVRADIANHGKLNYHLYQSMRHAIFKPAAFYRALILPMCQDELTVRESVILSSVLAKYSIAPLHSAVCMMKLTELEYSGPKCLVLKTLINKKYALPARVIAELTCYFHSFVEDERKMPLIWHQTLLVFVQRYKAQLSDEQIRLIRETIRAQSHHQVSRDIKREIDSVTVLSKTAMGSKSATNIVGMPSDANANITVVAMDMQ